MEQVKSEDLRIGSIIANGKMKFTILAISDPSCIGEDIVTRKAFELQLPLLKGIELTPKVLDACGFDSETWE